MPIDLAMDIKERIDRIARLGVQFKDALTSTDIIQAAIAQNNWLSSHDIVFAVDAITEQMLDHESLCRWVVGLNEPTQAKSVGVICAGNLPLVGFLDILAVVVSGNRCLYKLSSKDTVLMQVAIELLQKVCGKDMLVPLGEDTPDAIIATGSDNSGRYFRWRYGDIPSVIRGSRYSVAVITQQHSQQELELLWNDIFCYCGRGCRSVSELLVPRGYDVESLMQLWQNKGFGIDNANFQGSYLQNRALLTMQKASFWDGGYYIIKEGSSSLQPLSQIALVWYDSLDDAKARINQNRDKLQCVVGEGGVPFGCAQQPTLSDWADGVDLFNFLNSLH